MLGQGQLSGGKGSKGSSNSTGPNEGQGAGQRDGGTPEDTKFKTEKLSPRDLSQGDIVGSLPSEEEAPKGEAALPVKQLTAQALQRMAEKIESEALPAEYREQVLRYMESLRKGDASSGEKAAEESGAKGAAGEK